MLPASFPRCVAVLPGALVWAVELLRLGYLLAAQKLPTQQAQGAFIQCWVQFVMPVAIDLHFGAVDNLAPEARALEVS